MSPVDTQQKTDTTDVETSSVSVVPGIDPARLRTELVKAQSETEMWRMACAHIFNAFEADGVQLEITAASPAITCSKFDGKDTRTAWSRICDALLLRVQRLNRTVARQCDVPGFENRAAFCVPIQEEGEDADGAIAIVVPENDEALLRGYIEDVESVVRIVQVSLTEAQQAPATPTAGQNAADAVVRAASYSSLSEFAFAITNGLKTKLACDEVSLGIVKSDRVRVLCISGLDDAYPRTPGSVLIQQAMEECLDREAHISFPSQSPTDVAPAFALHQQWQQESGSAFVASFPLVVEEECVGVVSVRTSSPAGLSSEQIKSTQHILNPLAPGLVLLQQANQSLREHAVERTRDAITKIKPTTNSKRVAWAACLILSLYAVFCTTDYVVQVPCTIVAENMTEVSAPFAGRISAAWVEPGDHIVAGQLLVEFDVSELESQRKQALADYQIAQMELAVAAQNKDAASAGTAQNRAQSAKIRADIAAAQIANARICADHDGVILEGDLKPRIGEMVQLGTPLFRLAPSNSLAVEMQVTEHAAAFVGSQQEAEFVLNARPSDEFQSLVRRVNPSSTVRDGKNIFPALATPRNGQPGLTWLRPGMQGYARVNTGPQKVWWVWLHDIVDTVRLAAWSL